MLTDDNPNRTAFIRNLGLSIFTLLAIIFTDFSFYSPFFFGKYHAAYTAAAFAQDRIDVPPLIRRLSACHSYVQTLSFWHGSYTFATPFYRPLSLTVLWIQFHLFGVNHYELWLAVSIVLELLFCTLFAILVNGITGSWAAALCTLLIFAGPRTLPGEFPLISYLQMVSVAPSFAASTAWKDQPTQICDCLTVLTLILVRRERWLPALTCTLIAVLFKEAGWIIYALVFILLTAEQKLMRVPIWVYPAAAATIAIPLLIRHAVGMGYLGGLHMGTNRHWATRYILAVGGAYFRNLAQLTWPATVFATGMYLVIRARRPSIVVKLGLSLVILAIISVIEGINNHVDPPTALVMLLSPEMQLRYVLSSLIFVGCVDLLIQAKVYIKSALIFVALMLVAAIPFVAATQVLSHALELCYAFQSAIVGVVWVSGVRLIASWSHRSPPNLSPWRA